MSLCARAVGALLVLPAVAVAQNVAEVQVAPPSVTLRVGERTGLLATAFDRAGNVIPTVRVLWASQNIQVAKVDNNGTVTGVGNGVAIIEARVGSRTGTAAVQVVGSATPSPTAAAPPPAAAPPAPAAPPVDPSLAGQPAGSGPASSLRIDPPTIYLLPSENVRISPRALKDDGSAAAPIAVTWKSLRPDIANVDPSGLVVALAPGQGTIQVSAAGGLTATAPVVVQQADFGFPETALTLSPGDVDTLRVIVPTQGGRVVSALALQWTAPDPTIARVSLTGVVTAVGPGRTSVSVSGLLQQRSLDVVVHRPVELLAVRPRWQEEVLVPVNATAKFEAQALAADKTAVPEAPLRWAVSDTSIAAFDPATGILTGKRAGKTELVVKGPGQGLAATWSVRVIAATLKLSAARVGLTIGRHYAFKGSYADSSGAVIEPATSLAWVSDSPHVATVDSAGNVTAVGYGHAHLTATAPGDIRASADVFVQGEILIVSSRSGHFQLFAAERSNLGDLRPLGDDTLTAIDPAVSPDGSRIAFTSSRGIYVMDADGRNAARLTSSPGNDGHAQFTPDGNAVVFQSDRTGRPQIMVQQLSGGDPVALTQEPGANGLPSVSPDGETIAFVSTRDGATNVWLMSKDGTNQRPFTRASGNYKSTAPHFLRDGSLTYLLEGREEGGRTVTQVVKADLPTGHVMPLTGGDLLITDFTVSPAGDLLALVVSVTANGRPVAKCYMQPVEGGTGPVPVPAGAADQILTPAFIP